MSESMLEVLPKRGERVAAVVAHPDDESFGCGSLIAMSASSGARITVICATRGEAGERLPDPANDVLDLAIVRERELREAAAVLGAEAVELLDLTDSGFDGPLPHNSLCSLPVVDVAELLRTRFEALQTEVVLTIDGSDGHRDHTHIRDAVLEAVKAIPRQIRVVRWALPNSLMRRWIAEMQVLNPDAPYHELDLDSLGRPDNALTAIDASAHVDVREAAIACHRSQRSPYDGVSADLRRDFLSTDYVVIS